MEYKVVTEDRFDDVIQHLRSSFFSDEPLNKAVGLCQKGAGNRSLEKLSLEKLSTNTSIMAVTDNNEIAGVSVNGIIRPGDLESSKIQLEGCDDENFKKIIRLLLSQNLKTDLFESFTVDKIFDICILSVDHNYRGKGIAKELVKQNESIARQLDFKLLKTDATGMFSQKIFTSCGFKVIHEQFYDKIVDEFGKALFNVEAPHIKLQLLYKLLQ